MAFAGGVGADVTTLDQLPGPAGLDDEARLFGESCTRFVCEVRPDKADAFRATFSGLPVGQIGATVKDSRLRIAGQGGEWLVWATLAQLKDAWQKPLRW
jgi:hypothetical protein